MARIIVKDLPKEMKITTAELKRVKGGLFDVFYPSGFLKIDDFPKLVSPTLPIFRFKKI